MNIEIINPIKFQRWDKLLLTADLSLFFHSSAWAKVLYESYNYQPLYFTTIENEKLTFLIPIMEINSFLTGKRGVSLPFTDQCDSVIDNNLDFKSNNQEIIDYGKKANWRYIEWRGGKKFSNKIYPHTSYYSHKLELNRDIQKIFKILRSSTKRNIKKANKEGVRVEIKNSFESVLHFYKLNCSTRKMHGIPPQPWKFFKKIFEHIISKKKGFIAVADYKDKVIAAAVFFHFERKAIYKYGASNRSYQHLRPNNLIMWEAIRWYAQNDFKELDFGRTDQENQGLLQFKRGWGTKEEIIHYYRYDLIRNCFLSKQTGIKTSYNVFKMMPIPILRFIGGLLYRHVG